MGIRWEVEFLLKNGFVLLSSNEGSTLDHWRATIITSTTTIKVTNNAPKPIGYALHLLRHLHIGEWGLVSDNKGMNSKTHPYSHLYNKSIAIFIAASYRIII